MSTQFEKRYGRGRRLRNDVSERPPVKRDTSVLPYTYERCSVCQHMTKPPGGRCETCGMA